MKRGYARSASGSANPNAPCASAGLGVPTHVEGWLAIHARELPVREARATFKISLRPARQLGRGRDGRGPAKEAMKARTERFHEGPTEEGQS